VEIPDEPVTAALWAAGERWPDHAAIDFFGRTTSYRDLVTQVKSAAGALRALGVQRGDRVAIIVPNSAAHVVAFYATLRLGAIVVEHNPTYTAGELAHQLADSGATVALVWQKAVAAVVEALPQTNLRTVVSVDISKDLPRVKQLALRLPIRAAREQRAAMCAHVSVPDWHDLVAAATPLADDVPAADSTDIALLQYTGGTTGTPKAAILTHRNLVANLAQGLAWAKFTPADEVVYGALPFFHVFGLTLCLLLPAHIGATLVAFPKFDVDAVFTAQRRRPATFFPGVAPMFERMSLAAEQAGSRVDLTSVRFAIAGAMPITAETAARWERVTDSLLIEGYGMTEASPMALGNPCTEERRPGALGLPFPSTEIRIVDEDLIDAEADADGIFRGELLIRGPQVFTGYWNRPEETALQVLADGWIRTGDVVAMDTTGFVVLVDRIKEMIITGGFKVYPSQVEDHLRSMPGIRDVAVVGIPGEGSDERVTAAIVLEDADQSEGITLASIRAWGEQRLARYALPRELVILTELPRSQIGKVMRRVVRDGLLAQQG
jgi:long-chain acyl-CoA synthetase